MTSSALEQEAVEQGATLIADVTHRWAYPDSYCYAEFPGGVDSVWATEEFIRMVEAYRNAMARLEPNAPVQPFPQERSQPRQEAPQRPRTNERRGSSGGDDDQSYREQQFPLVDGYECDKCGGPIGLFETRNGARLGKCLSTCKDGKYVHTLKDAKGELVFLDD